MVKPSRVVTSIFYLCYLHTRCRPNMGTKKDWKRDEVMGTMRIAGIKCPKCGAPITTQGVPHSPEIKRQWECRCDAIVTE